MFTDFLSDMELYYIHCPQISLKKINSLVVVANYFVMIRLVKNVSKSLDGYGSVS